MRYHICDIGQACARLDSDALTVVKSSSAVAPAFRSQAPKMAPPLTRAGLHILGD